jgi:hypothetical protein
MTQTPDEDILCLQISEGMLPFEQKHCPECGGEGKVPAGNVRGVMLSCKPCKGTGLLSGDPEQVIRRFVSRDLNDTIARSHFKRGQISWEALKMLRTLLKKMRDDEIINSFRLQKVEDVLELTYWTKGLGRKGRSMRITFGTSDR